MNLQVFAESAYIDKLAVVLEHLGADNDALVLCATSAQENDIGKMLALSANQRPIAEKHSSRSASSLSSYTSKLWDRWGDERTLVGATIRAKIIEQVLENFAAMQSFQTVGGKKLLTQLASSCIPEVVDNAEREASSKVVNNLARLLTKYHDELRQSGYIEHQYAIWLLSKKIREHAVSLEDKKLVVVGFSDFTRSQIELLCACAAQVEVYVLLDYEKDGLSDEYIEQTISEFKGRGARSFALPLHLSKQTYCLPVLGKAQGRAAEVSLMADFAQEAHERGSKESKALLVNNIYSYIRPLAAELERRNVPYELDLKTPFSSTSFGSSILALLRICIDKDAQVSGLSFALSPYSGLTPDQVTELDTRWRRYRVEGSSILTQLAKHESAACKCLELIRGRNMSAHIVDWYILVNQLYSLGIKAHECSDFDLRQDAAAQKSVISVLQELYEQSLAQHKHTGSAQSEAQAKQLEQFTQSRPGNRILRHDPRIAAAELYAALCDARVNQTPKPASTAILIAEPARALGRKFHTVIVGGLSASDERERVDNPLDIRLASKLTGLALPDLVQQQYYLYAAMRALATNRLFLVSQNQLLSGEELQSGSFLNYIQRQLGEKYSQLESRLKTYDQVVSAQCFADKQKRKEVETLLFDKCLKSPLRDPVRGEEATYNLGHEEGAPTSATSLEKFASCPYNWLLTRYVDGKDIERGFDALRQGIFAHQVLKCFYEQLPEKGIGERINNQNLTEALILYQEIFNQEESTLKEGLILTAAEQAEMDMLRIHLEAFLRSEVDYAPEFIPKYLELHFAASDSGGSDSTNNTDSTDGSGSPDSIRANEDENDVQRALDFGLGLPLHGTIDRIDIRPDDNAALIIDYKKSGKTGGLQAQANQNMFQGLLYRKAAQQVLGVRPVSHSYRAYADSSKKPNEAYLKADNLPNRPLGLPKIGRGEPWGLSEKEMTAQSERIMASAAQAAKELRAGVVALRENKSLCRFCLYERCEFKVDNWGAK